MSERFNQGCVRLFLEVRQKLAQLKTAAIAARREESGQGTTEYAILVGVLVVIAIGAITLFKPKLEDLWNAIVTGMEAL